MTDKELYYKLEPEGCWHEPDTYESDEIPSCKHCQLSSLSTMGTLRNPDFSTWAGFCWLWGRATSYGPGLIDAKYVNPEAFRDALKEFFDGRGK